MTLQYTMFKTYSTLLILCLVILSEEGLIKERIQIIDEHNNNFLLRGNLPIENNKFQYQELRQTLNEKTNSTGHQIVIISLLNFLTPKETKNRYIEERFTEKYQLKNQLIYENYVVLGSLMSPQTTPNFLKNFFISYDNWVSFDKLNTLMKKIKKYLKSSKPTIIYVHCSAGVDRTGYVGGAYKMKYFENSLEEVIEENLAILKGLRNNMHFNTYNGLQWFCLSLGRTQKQCLIGQNKNYKKNNKNK